VVKAKPLQLNFEMMMSVRFLPIVFSLVTLTILVNAGCGRGPTQVPVSGTVTFDGEPVQDGEIAFEPRGTGKMQFGVVTDGKYAIPAKFGLVPGDYVVRITASRSTGQKAEVDSFVTAEDSLEVNEQFLPPKYNSASQLSVTIEPTAEAKHDFALTSK
jgi:hypothetical protein